MAPRTVIVTGGSSGIGYAAAARFVAAGDDVAIVARTSGRLEQAAEKLSAATTREGQRITWKSADLSDFSATNAVFAELAAEGFGPDILVNSAGVNYPGEFATMPLEDFEANIQCGFWSVVYPCRAVVPGMCERHRGHIVNISSVAGYLGIYGYTGHSASKFAVMGFTEALRCEMKPCGVKVSVVCPPDTDTPALAIEHTMRPPETHAISGGIKPVSADKVGAAIFNAVEKGRYLVIPDRLSGFYFRLKGLLPEVFYAIVDDDVAKVKADV